MKTLLLSAAVCIGFSTAAHAAACGPTDDVHNILANKYGEELVGTGIVPNGSLIEIWANTTTDSFTVIVNDGAGTSCMIASGQSWVEAVRKPNT